MLCKSYAVENDFTSYPTYKLWCKRTQFYTCNQFLCVIHVCLDIVIHASVFNVASIVLRNQPTNV